MEHFSKPEKYVVNKTPVSNTYAMFKLFKCSLCDWAALSKLDMTTSRNEINVLSSLREMFWIVVRKKKNGIIYDIGKHLFMATYTGLQWWTTVSLQYTSKSSS